MRKKVSHHSLNDGQQCLKDAKRAALDSYTPRHAKPSRTQGSSYLRAVTVIAVFSIGLIVGAWIWMSARDGGISTDDLAVSYTHLTLPTKA